MNILETTKDFIIIDKPAGLVVHADGRTEEDTLVDLLLKEFPEIEGVGESMFIKKEGKEVEIKRPGIVHRLDRDTSGAMVVARNQDAFMLLKALFQNREVEKEYRAFIYGAPKQVKGVVDAPIGRSPKDFRRWSAQPGARGNLREAQTEWRILDVLEHEGEKFSYIACLPKTGRTHQIRVHMKYMHHPIVSDPLYAGKRKPALGFKRQALHAHKISFSWGGGVVSVEAPFPEDFQSIIDQNDLKA